MIEVAGDGELDLAPRTPSGNPTRTRTGTGTDEPNDKQGIGNKVKLWVAMISFSLFAVAELVAAFLAHSDALLGDALTMMVDGVTYGVNIWAERAKEGRTEQGKIKIDIVAPAVSIAALLAVTVYITIDSINELGTSPEEAADATVMWIFALVNLVLDFVNLALFVVKKTSDGRYYLSFSLCRCRSDDSREQKVDLNMMSALVHVCADTLRSLAVMVAGIVADEDIVSSTDADAVGGIVVSIAIVISVIPLLAEMREKQKALQYDSSSIKYNALLLDNDAWELANDGDDDDDDVVLSVNDLDPRL